MKRENTRGAQIQSTRKAISTFISVIGRNVDNANEMSQLNVDTAKRNITELNADTAK